MLLFTRPLPKLKASALAFENAGIYVARDPSEIGNVLVTALKDAGLR